MELFFPCCYDAFPVPAAPSKNQQRADKRGFVPERGTSAPLRAAAWHERGWPIGCLASVALLVSAACSSLAETESSTSYGTPGMSGAPGNSPGSGEPPAASPTNAESPMPTTDPAGGDSDGENQGPRATETNFLTLPCNTDADCGGSRCILPTDAGAFAVPSGSDAGAREAGVSDSGSTDGGLTDAAAANALPRGRCSPGN